MKLQFCTNFYWVPVIVTEQLNVVRLPVFAAAVNVSVACVVCPAGRLVFCWFQVRVSEEQDGAECTSEIIFHPLPRDDPKRRCPDTNKLEKLVLWKPNVGFDEGLKKTITWFKQKIEG